jgi:molecular chaperone GrpE
LTKGENFLSIIYMGIKKGPVSKLKEAYLELFKEYEAYCGRKEGEIRELKCLSALPLLQSLIPILDDFERALANGEKGNPERRTWLDGIRLVYNNLKKALSDFGVEEYSLLGQEFDPRLGEAVDFVNREDLKPLIVVEELAEGYSFRGKVLRPAKVIVNKEGKSEK